MPLASLENAEPCRPIPAPSPEVPAPGPQAAAPAAPGRRLHAASRAFARESAARSWWHIASTFALLLAALAGAALAPWWPVRLAASLLGALTMVRAFILFHDYMHGAILPGSRPARLLLYAYALVLLTPPRSWRASHNAHHAEVGTIEGSDTGSFPLMTTDAWRAASPRERLAYRLARHPATILLGYVTVFLVNICLLPLLRRPSRHWDSAVSLAAHAAALAGLWLALGFDAAFFALILPVAVSSAVGSYLFYAQHSFPGMQVLDPAEWTHDRAALVSSSQIRFPPVLGWFAGNIGYHHVHHLNPLIPFYRLPEAMAGLRELQDPVVTSLHPRDVLACFRSNLWDAEAGRMVRYRDVALSA